MNLINKLENTATAVVTAVTAAAAAAAAMASDITHYKISGLLPCAQTASV